MITFNLQDDVALVGQCGNCIKFGCLQKLINIVRSRHEGIMAIVIQKLSERFPASNGVIQDCVLVSNVQSPPLECCFNHSPNLMHV